VRAPRRAQAARPCPRADFFFQAEDGIRDFHVTGVQTCALPIYPELSGDQLVRLSDQTATLGMSNNYIAHPEVRQHTRGNFPGEGPLRLTPDVLRTQNQLAAVAEAVNAGQIREGRTYDYINAINSLCQLRQQIFDQRTDKILRAMHFPVCGNQRPTHIQNPVCCCRPPTSDGGATITSLYSACKKTLGAIG